MVVRYMSCLCEIVMVNEVLDGSDVTCHLLGKRETLCLNGQ